MSYKLLKDKKIVFSQSINCKVRNYTTQVIEVDGYKYCGEFNVEYTEDDDCYVNFILHHPSGGEKYNMSIEFKGFIRTAENSNRILAFLDADSDCFVGHFIVKCEIIPKYLVKINEIQRNDIKTDILLASGKFNKITFEVDDKTIEANLIVMCARSPVIKKQVEANLLFKVDNHQFFITDFEITVVEKMVEFCEEDDIKNFDGLETELLRISEEYDIKPLRIFMTQKIADIIDVETFFYYYNLSQEHNLEELKELCIGYAALHTTSILLDPGILKLDPDNFKELIYSIKNS